MGTTEVRLEIRDAGESWLVDAQLDGASWSELQGVRMELDEADTEGHLPLNSVQVVAHLADDDGDDVEGHTLTLRFPTPAEAQAFRRRALGAGVLVATVALAAPGAVAAMTIQDPLSGQIDALVQPTEEPDRGQEGFGVTRIR